MTNINNLEEIISNHKSELLDYIDRDRTSIKENPIFKILYENILSEFHSRRVNNEAFFNILINYTQIVSLDLKKINANLKSIINDCLKTNNYVVVDSGFDIILKNTKTFHSQQEARKFFEEESKKFCVFTFSPEGVDCFINGKCDNKFYFYTKNDLKKFVKKKSISEIKSVLEEYTNTHLKERSVYSKFFISKEILIEWFGKKDFKKDSNILKNRPEDLFQSDLCEYLNDKLIHNVQLRETNLLSKKRLDIFTEDEGKNYFFEIKWLGKSVKGNAVKDNYTSYSDADIRNGIIQTLEYIEELIINMKHDIGCGFLIVFDARDDIKEIDFNLVFT
jgi:hypothetical protein